MDDSYQALLSGNRSWVERTKSNDPEFFDRLATGQAPRFLWIGCADSRVPTSQITDTMPGDIFVHRNIANMVVHTDINMLSVLQYAVDVLEVEHVIVCGHYGCGGVKAAIDGKHHGLIDKWLRNIKDVHRMYYDELSVITDPELKHRRLVELNVREQVYHLCMTSIVQKAWKNERGIHVHGWVYDIENGLIKDLDIDIEKEFKDHPELDVFEFDNL